jgi:hypothetical protein
MNDPVDALLTSIDAQTQRGRVKARKAAVDAQQEYERGRVERARDLARECGDILCRNGILEDVSEEFDAFELALWNGDEAAVEAYYSGRLGRKR